MSEEQTVTYELDGEIALVGLNRPDKRNCFNPDVMKALRIAIDRAGEEAKCGIIFGHGDNFCAGLDLNELKEASTSESFETSVVGQRLNETVQFCKVPVIAVLHGAVIGGGMELAAAAHIRIAETSAYYALPEGTRGIFLGSGGSVRLPRLIGPSMVIDMMLTGRVYDATEGLQQLRFTQYLVDPGCGLKTAVALAEKVAKNAPLANYAIVQAIPRIVEQDPANGLFTEMLMVTLAQADEEAKLRLRDFLERKAGKVVRV